MEGAVSQVDSFDYKPMLAKFHGQDPRRAIGKLEKSLAAAKAAGDEKKVPETSEALDARRAWLAQAEHAIAEFSGS